MTGSLVIGRQPNPRPVNAEGEFVAENDPTVLTRKVDDPDTAVYLLNEKLQVKLVSVAEIHLPRWKGGKASRIYDF